MDSEGAIKRRRRGDVLEDAILDAAWDVLSEGGHGAFTLDAVARRARTSRTVLARRWDDRAALMKAALWKRGREEDEDALDTGSLRNDA